MTIKLDDIELAAYIGDSSQGTLRQLRTVTSVKVSYPRRIYDGRIASTEGSVLGDAGRHAMRILLSGSFIGEEALQGLKFLEDKHRKGVPYQFISDLTLLAKVKTVLIEGLVISTMMGKENSYFYEIVLREYNEPPAEGKAPNQDKEAGDEVDKESDLQDIVVEVSTPSREIVKNAKVLIKGPDKEILGETDDNGLVEILDASEGKYEITVKDDERFKDVKKEIEIKKKKA